ncbi:winged helix-turn-helix domain-containing protein [Ideonella sp. YS5]|uniref:winged helix-turn-helix domain-containing protein n=1 Tax=Ideonella sp. YS5 TaxID=3453714 RepID=UPI003EEEAA5F
MSQETFRFGRCELRVASRELHVDEELRPIERRPFDLLVYLLRQRHRVVSKDELLNEVWSGEDVTPGVIASAVLKLRKLIEDKDADAPLIGTAHRVGYRFVGQVEGAAPAAAAVAAAENPTIALLPFENRTGQPDLDWVELGLLSLVQKALATHRRLEVATIPSVLAALRTVPAEATLAQRVEALGRLLGTTHVVQVVVTGIEGAYQLEATLAGATGTNQQHLAGPDLPQLGQALAARLEAALKAGPTAPLDALEGTSAVANWTLGRAMQAAAENKWHVALNLLDAVLQMEPAHALARVERLRVLVALDDSQAFEAGPALVLAARATGNRAQEAEVRLELAQAYLKRRLNDQARLQIDEVLQAAEGIQSPAYHLNLCLLRAELALSQLDWPTAEAMLERADALCAQTGNVFDRIRMLQTLLVLKAETGDMRKAWAHASEAVELYRRHGILVGQARAECNLSIASGALGMFREAEEHGELALSLSRSMNVWISTVVAASGLCGLYRQLRKPHHLARVLRDLEEAHADNRVQNPMYHLVGRAQLAMARDQHSEAVLWLQDAAVHTKHSGRELDHHFVLPLLAGAQVHAGRLDEAAATCAQMRASAGFARDAQLRTATLHCEAQLALARGDRAGALARLLQAREGAALGWWRALASLDAAWLAAETGDTDAAHTLTQDLNGWVDEHPVGKALQARLARAEQRHSEADWRHRQLAASLGDALPGYWAELGRYYAAAAADPGAGQIEPPLTPRLPTSI